MANSEKSPSFHLVMLRSLQSSSVRFSALRLGFSSAFYLVLMLLASSALRSGAFAQTTWLNVNQASFADPSNWSSSAPSFTNAAVIDYHNTLNPVPGTVHTLTVFQAIGLGDLTLGDLAVTDPDAYRIVGAAITFGKTGGSALVKQGLARDAIASAINLGSPLNVNVAAGSGGLDLQGAIGIGTVTKLGGGTLVLSGTSNNSINLINAQQGVLELAKASSLTVKAVTTALNVGGSTSADTATVKIGGTYVGLGATHLSNYRDQISNNTVVTLNAFGTLDLNGNSEGLSQLLGTGKVTNSVVDTVSTLLVGEASAVNTVFGGVIEDGLGKVSLVKASGVSLSLTAANTFTGRVAVANGVLSLTGTGGSIATLAIDVNRGTLLLDNLTNHSSQNRINDAATVTLSEGGVMIIRRSTVGDTSETIGTLAVANGHNIIRFDHSSGSSAAGILANSITLQITDYTRSVGGTVGFAEAATAAAPAGNNYFSSTAPAAATTLSKIILTNLPSNWLVGGDASTAFNRKVLIGAFGNLLENSVSNRVGTRLMTVENVGGINYIRPLDTSEFREIGGGAVNRIITGSNLIGGSPASGPTDNVKITGAIGAAASPLTIKIQAVDNQLAGHIAFNSWWIEAPVSTTVLASNAIRIAENNIVHLGDFAGDDLHAATTGGSGTIFINGGLATTAGGPGYGTVYLRGGTIDFGSREGIIYLDVTNGAHIYSTLTGSGGVTKTGNGQAHYYGWNTYSGVSTLAANELWFYTDTALGQNGAGNGMINYGSFLMNNGINVGSLTDDTQQKELVMKGGVFYAAGSKSNSWNGDILLDNINDAGEYSPLTFNVRTNANMIINGDVTGTGAPSPVLNSALESGRTLNIINESVASVRGTSGIFHLTGILSDYEGRAALENYEKLQLRIAAYTTGATSVSRNKFNVFIDDARNTNPYLDFYSGYLHLKNGMGVDNTSFTVTAFRQTDNSTVFDRSNNITALLLGDAGSAFRTASFTYGRNIGAQYSSNSVALIGGENTSGTVTFGNSNGGTTFTFTVNGTAATKTTVAGSNFSATRTATFIDKATQITVDSATDLKVGMLVTGAGIPLGTRVAAIVGTTVYLTVATTNNGAGTSLSFYELSNKITLADVTNLQVGMGITGTGIPDGTFITAINGTVVTLSSNLNKDFVPTAPVTVSIPQTVTNTLTGAPGSVTKIQNFGEVRLYQAQGGTSEFLTSFTDGAGYTASGVQGALTKVGRGTSILKGGTTSSDLNGGINVLGGALVLDYRNKAADFSHVSGTAASQAKPYQLTLAGGELRLVNEGATTSTNTENLRGILTLRGGNSTVTIDPGDEKTLNLNLGLDNLTPRLNADGKIDPNWNWRAPDRFAGATVTFFADATVKGSANFFYSQNAPGGAAVGGGGLGASTIIPYSTFKYRNESGQLFVDFAAFMVENGNTRIVDAAGYIANSANLYNANSGGGASSVGSWNTYLNNGANGYFTDDAFGGTQGFKSDAGNLLAGNIAGVDYSDFVGARAIRFAASADSTIKLKDEFTRLVLGTQSLGGFEGPNAAADGGAILVSNSVGAHNQSITGGYITSAQLSSYFTTAVPANSSALPAYTSRDLIIHNFNTQGTFTLDSTIVDYTDNHDLDWPGISKLNLIVAGPGTTKLAKLNNYYTGNTYVSGGAVDAVTGLPEVGTLWVASSSSLGTGAVYLNGGRLKLATMDNPATGNATTTFSGAGRPFVLGGNGGYIDVTSALSTVTISSIIRSEDNILYGNTAGNQMSANVGVGDLIKEGAGRLILTNNAAIPANFATSALSTLTWNAYYGLTVIKAGALQVNIAGLSDSGILGSNDSTIDGTIIEEGARLDFVGIGGSTKEWITVDGGTIGTTGGHSLGTIDGVITVTTKGATFDISATTGTPELRLNNTEGYVIGTGTITKTGNGTLALWQNNAEFTGDWNVLAGSVIGHYGAAFGAGNKIFLGAVDSSATGITGVYLKSNQPFSTRYQILSDIEVRASASNQVKQIGVTNISGQGYNNDTYIFAGDIALNGAANLYYKDSLNNGQLAPVAGDPDGSHQTGAFRHILLDGQLSGTGKLTTVVEVGATGSAAKVFFNLNNDNSSWSGALKVGNDTFNTVQQHYLRLGHDKALTAANAVTLDTNAYFQVGGKNVTIGNLKAEKAAGTGASAGSVAGTNQTIVENASNQEGTLTVVQTGATQNWDILFQDGTTPTWYSGASAAVYSNRLNLTKAGTATAVLTQLNTYTGVTNVDVGNLQVGSGGTGTRASADLLGRTGTGGVRINNGGTLSGTGVVQGRAGIIHQVNSGGKLAPGDINVSGESLLGTLFMDGGLVLNSGGVIELQITASTLNSGGLADSTNTSVYNAALLALPGTAALANPIGTTQHDHLEINGQMDFTGGGTVSVVNLAYNVAIAGDVFNLIDWSSVSNAGFNAGGTFRFGGELGSNLLLPTLSNGLGWDTSLFAAHGILVVTAVPEPGRMALLVAGLTVLALRRRRRHGL